MSDDNFYKAIKAKPLLDRLEWAAFKMCKRGHHEDFASEVMTEAKARIEAMEAALVRIWSWYPTNVSNPHQQINEMKDFAFSIIKKGNEDAKSD